MLTCPDRIPPMLALTLFAAACGPQASFTEADRQVVATEVSATLAGLLEAINAHDPERAMSFYSDAPDFVALTCTSYISGGTTYKGMVGPTYGPRRATTFEQRIVSMHVLSPTSAVASQQGSSSKAPALFWTRALVKEGGRWVITYEHQSWPGCNPPPAPHPYTTPGDSASLSPGGISN